jgi:hypothetical protein
MTAALKTFLETEIARQEREIVAMQRKVAKGDVAWQAQIDLNRRNIAGYRAELEAV